MKFITALIAYVLENLSEPLLPSIHYDSILSIMLFHDIKQQIRALQSFLLDLQSLQKVIMDRLFTSFNQHLLTCNLFEDLLCRFTRKEHSSMS